MQGRRTRPYDYGKMYQRAHQRNTRWFSGHVESDCVDAIAELVRMTGAVRLLDFGAGKGYQYLADRIHDRWGGILPYCYDPGLKPIARKPDGAFDGVICTDVMEHIAEGDIENTLDEIFGCLHNNREVFAYFNVSCNLSGKQFPDGQSVHLTVKPPEWWNKIFKRRIRNNLLLWVHYDYTCGDDMSRKGLE